MSEKEGDVCSKRLLGPRSILSFVVSSTMASFVGVIVSVLPVNAALLWALSLVCLRD